MSGTWKRTTASGTWGRTTRGTDRGQSNLVSVAAALVALTAATTLGLALADTAFSGSDREVADRRVAVSLSERLVAPSSPLTARANVLNESTLGSFDGAALRASFPVVGNRSVRVQVGDRTIAERGEPTGGYTFRRIVLVQRRQAVTRTPTLSNNRTTVPRRTTHVQLRIDPPNGTNVTAVRADGRVVLLNRSGLDGTFTVRVSRFETVQLHFETDGPLSRGTVSVTYYPERTTKAILEVTVRG